MKGSNNIPKCKAKLSPTSISTTTATTCDTLFSLGIDHQNNNLDNNLDNHNNCRHNMPYSIPSLQMVGRPKHYVRTNTHSNTATKTTTTTTTTNGFVNRHARRLLLAAMISFVMKFQISRSMIQRQEEEIDSHFYSNLLEFVGTVPPVSSSNMTTTTATKNYTTKTNHPNHIYLETLRISLEYQWDQLDKDLYTILPKAIVPSSNMRRRMIKMDNINRTSMINTINASNFSTNTTTNKDDVTVLVHLSTTKLNRLRFLLHRWGNGPTSVAIYLSSYEEISTFIHFVQKEYNKQESYNYNLSSSSSTTSSSSALPPSSSLWKLQNMIQNTTFHLLLHKKNEGGDFYYPHNRLRQLALTHCDSDFFVTLDVDFVTLPNCHDELYKLLFPTTNSNSIVTPASQKNPTNRTGSATSQSPQLSRQGRERGGRTVAEVLRQEKIVMVLPAFNYDRSLTDDDLDDGLLPQSRNDTIQMVERGTITAFHVEQFFHGHGPTNYPQWYNRSYSNNNMMRNNRSSDNGSPRVRSKEEEQEEKSDDHDDQYYSINYTPKYEPYILGYRPSGIPSYWLHFRGFGFDKYSWFLELHYSGYQFAVLYDFCIFHLDHSYPGDRNGGDRGGGRPKRMIPEHNIREMELFVTYLMRRYQAPAADFEENFIITDGSGGNGRKTQRKYNNNKDTKNMTSTSSSTIIPIPNVTWIPRKMRIRKQQNKQSRLRKKQQQEHAATNIKS